MWPAYLIPEDARSELGGVLHEMRMHDPDLDWLNARVQIAAMAIWAVREIVKLRNMRSEPYR